MIRPICVVSEAAISYKQISYVMDALSAFLQLLGVFDLVPVVCIDDVIVGARMELEHSLAEASFGSPPNLMVDSDLLADLFSQYCDKRNLSCPTNLRPYYVIVVDRDLRYSRTDQFQIYGLRTKAYNAIITVRDYFSKTRLADDTEERIKNTTIHELGHMFGLIPETRTADVFVGEHGKHCANKCIMRETAEPSFGLVGIELDRALCKSFCLRCFVHLAVEGWKIRSNR